MDERHEARQAKGVKPEPMFEGGSLRCQPQSQAVHRLRSTWSMSSLHKEVLSPEAPTARGPQLSLLDSGARI